MTKQQHPADSAPLGATDPAKPGRLAALRASITKRLPRISSRAKIGIGVTLTLLIVNGAVLSIWAPKLMQSQAETRATLPKALAALDRHWLSEAKFMATALQQSPRLEPADRGGPAFVLGAALAQEAELLPASDRGEMYRSAARYLEEARQRGFPEGRQVDGLFLLGKCLYATGNLVDSRTVLEEAFVADPKLADSKLSDQQFNADAFQILASDYFSGARPDDHKALSFIERYLTTTSLTDAQRDSARLLEARIQDRLGDVAASKKSLAEIPESSTSYAAALLFESELLMREANSTNNDSSNNLYHQAIEKLDRAERDRSATNALALRCMYLIGVCEQSSGQLQDALAQFQQVRTENPKSDESIAAIFRTATLLRRQGREDEAVAAYRQVVQAIGDPDNYKNNLLSIEEVRKELLSVYQQSLSAAKFDSAGQLSRLLHPLFPKERDLELQGELLRSAANSYRAKAESAPSGEAKVLIGKARASARQAGVAFAKLAELHTTSRLYTDDLWNAAYSYFDGQDYHHTTKFINLYLTNELRRRRATALLLLGESQLALGQTEKGLAALNECIEAYAADPASFRARLLLAKMLQEAGENDKAEQLLRSNLEDGKLTPRSVEWRDSL
ncbi:MAG TPA: tetratricopeptide repeat protein, partial [Pirellulales bacterium]